jgi:hypothetical protein
MSWLGKINFRQKEPVAKKRGAVRAYGIYAASAAAGKNKMSIYRSRFHDSLEIYRKTLSIPSFRRQKKKTSNDVDSRKS